MHSHCRRGNRLSFILCGGIILIGIALRVYALFTDFWTDEIASWVLATNMSNLLDIFSIQHVNNHHLNTLFLYLLGEHSNWIIYRIPSLIFGISSLLCVWHLTLKENTPVRVISLLLFALSFLLILHASEARGYAGALFFALLSFILLTATWGNENDPTQQKARNGSLRGGWGRCILFWIALILGILSHLSFLVVLLGCAASILHAGYISKGRHTFREALTWLSVPIVFLGTLFALVLGDSIQMGADREFSTSFALIETLTLPVGAAHDIRFALLSALLMVALLVWGLRTLWKKGLTSSWWFYAIVLLSPFPLFIIGMYFNAWGVRFIVIPIAFFFLLLGKGLGAFWIRGGTYRLLSLIVLLPILIGNVWHISAFSTVGRGGYLRALTEIVKESTGQKVHIGTEGFNVFLAVQFYEPFLPPHMQYQVILPDTIPDDFISLFTVEGKENLHTDIENSPEWYITHSRTYRTPVPFLTVNNTAYSLYMTYPYLRESGHSWYLYKADIPTIQAHFQYEPEAHSSSILSHAP